MTIMSRRLSLTAIALSTIQSGLSSHKDTTFTYDDTDMSVLSFSSTVSSETSDTMLWGEQIIGNEKYDTYNDSRLYYRAKLRAQRHDTPMTLSDIKGMPINNISHMFEMDPIERLQEEEIAMKKLEIIENNKNKEKEEVTVFKKTKKIIRKDSIVKTNSAELVTGKKTRLRRLRKFLRSIKNFS